MNSPDLYVLLDVNGDAALTFREYHEAAEHLDKLEAHVRARLRLACYKCALGVVPEREVFHAIDAHGEVVAIFKTYVDALKFFERASSKDAVQLARYRCVEPNVPTTSSVVDVSDVKSTSAG